VLGRWVPGWKRNFERFYHYQDFMEEKDLFALDTFNDLLDVIERADEKIEAYQEKKDYHDADEGTEVFRDDDEWRIYALHNKGAACHFGKNTEWCTAAPGLDYFESYYRPDDPLFYFEHEPTNEDQFFAPNERWQFHYGSEQFMDENDRELSPGEAFKFHKLLMQTGAPEKYPVVSQYLDTIKQREDAMKRWRVPPMVPLMENWRKYLLKEAGDFDWDAFGFSDEERGESIPNPPQYEDLISLDRGDTFTIGNRKPVYRIIGALGSSVGATQKTAVIDGSAERKYYIIKPVGDEYAVGAFEAVGGTMDSVDEPRGGKTGFVMNITKAQK